MANIGFIGTGIMGAPMAENLQTAGHSLYFSEHYKPAPAHLVAAGGTVCADPAAVAAEAEIIITMVPDTPQVEAIAAEVEIRHPLVGSNTHLMEVDEAADCVAIFVAIALVLVSSHVSVQPQPNLQQGTRRLLAVADQHEVPVALGRYSRRNGACEQEG